MKGVVPITESLIVSVFCMLVLAVLILGTNLHNGARDASAKRFTILLYTALFYLIVAFFSDFLEGRPEYSPLNFFFNLMSFLAIDATLVAFTYYLAALLKDEERTRILALPYFTCLLRVALLVILASTGKLFTIENGCYEEGTWAIVPYVVSCVVMLELLFIVNSNKDCFSGTERIVIFLYLLLPVGPVILETFIRIYFLTSLSLTLSILLVYVLVQAETIDRGRLRESVLEEISCTDLLTNLNNRRAFYNFLSGLSPDEKLGVLFCDVNGLKNTNDKYGHAAGDELLKHFGNMLTLHFSEEHVFRISGDEFVCLIPSLDEEAMIASFEAFRKEVEEADSIASLGYACGTGDAAEHLISAAETAMYEDKDVYYLTHPRRGAV